MIKKINIVIYGEAPECLETEKMISTLPFFENRSWGSSHAHSWEAFEIALTDTDPHLAIVMADGAAGMEGVYLTRSRRPELPVIWFSDDYDFGMQSHRLECVYFSTKPITEEKMVRAINRYSQLWNAR